MYNRWRTVIGLSISRPFFTAQRRVSEAQDRALLHRTFQPNEPRDPQFREMTDKRLEAALWGGFMKGAVNELLWRARADPLDNAPAWTLARWAASEGRFDLCQDFTEIGTFPDDFDYKWSFQRDLVRAYAQLHTGRGTRHTNTSGAKMADYLLTFALNCIQGRSLPAANGTDSFLLTVAAAKQSERIERLNALYSHLNLPPVSTLSPVPTLDTISSVAPVNGDGPKLSVIVPAYNCASTLPSAIRSILGQSWRNLEVIIVDDASVDGTPAIIAELAATDTRIKVVEHAENRGAYAARNTALKRPKENSSRYTMPTTGPTRPNSRRRSMR